MSFIKSLFKRPEDPFYTLLYEHSKCTLHGLKMLEDYMKTRSMDSMNGIHEVEKEADEIRRILIHKLNSTFITPFDREDIYNLSRAIDDVVDYADTTVDGMDLLKVEPNEFLIRMAVLLRESGEELSLAIFHLKDHNSVTIEHCKQVKALENKVEAVYREAIADLFHGKADNKHILKLLKLREVYRHLSNAADRGDEAANIINGIVVKMS